MDGTAQPTFSVTTMTRMIICIQNRSEGTTDFLTRREQNLPCQSSLNLNIDMKIRKMAVKELLQAMARAPQHVSIIAASGFKKWMA
jgi:hypothetical protein